MVGNDQDRKYAQTGSLFVSFCVNLESKSAIRESPISTVMRVKRLLALSEICWIFFIGIN